MIGKVQYPEKCSRGRCDCQPYALLESNTDPSEPSFFCVGNNGGVMSPTVPSDKYTVCFKGQFRDEMAFFDERDLIHQIYVISAALVHINLDHHEERNPKWDDCLPKEKGE
jgi:hypothetical protein